MSPIEDMDTFDSSEEAREWLMDEARECDGRGGFLGIESGAGINFAEWGLAAAGAAAAAGAGGVDLDFATFFLSFSGAGNGAGTVFGTTFLAAFSCFASSSNEGCSIKENGVDENVKLGFEALEVLDDDIFLAVWERDAPLLPAPPAPITLIFA